MAPIRAVDIVSLGDDAFLCHYSRRHQFPLPDWFISEYAGLEAWRARLECPCKTVKVVYCQPETMVEWSSHYEHPDHYLLESGPAATLDLRKESLARSQDRLAGRNGTVRSLRGRRKKKETG